MNTQTLQQKTISLCSTSQPTIVLGLSGGPDSVFLFHILRELHEEKKITLIAAHLNHGWRESAQQDQEFCSLLCEKYHTPFEVAHANEITAYKKSKGSLEEEGRNKRRAFFESIAQKYKAHAIALAHHADDQIETFFIRLIRGATLDGLSGMKEKNGLYIRPLLNCSKEEILNYLKEHNYQFCIDETNESPNYLRNRVRNELVTAFKKVDSRSSSKMLSTLSHLQEENELLKQLTHETFETIFTLTPDSRYEGNVSLFKNLNAVLQRRIILKWLIKEKVPFSPSLGHLEEIRRFLISDRGGTHALYSKVLLLKAKNAFNLSKIAL